VVVGVAPVLDEQDRLVAGTLEGRVIAAAARPGRDGAEAVTVLVDGGDQRVLHVVRTAAAMDGARVRPQVVGDHVGRDHAQDVGAGVIGDVGARADEPLLLAVEGDEPDGVRRLVLAQDPGRFHDQGGAAAVVIGARVVHGVVVSADDVLLCGMNRPRHGGDHVVVRG
jgi:hypothetical protein